MNKIKYFIAILSISNFAFGDETVIRQLGCNGLVKKNGTAGTYVLKQSCKLTKISRPIQGISIEIASSNIKLDCSGNIFDGNNQPNAGLKITNYSLNENFKQVKNVVVKDCVFQNYGKQGISVATNFVGAKVSRFFGGISLTDLVQADGSTKLQQQSRNAENIKFDQVTVRNNAEEGIYFFAADNSQLINSRVTGNGGVGIYLEAGTKENIIKNNIITGNGRLYQREGIAVDSSYRNLIEGNTLAYNVAGGIFLYRNSWEQPESMVSHPRPTKTYGNLIKNNTFENMRVGVWVASRQSLDYSTHSLEWGEASPYTEQMKGYHYFSPTQTKDIYKPRPRKHFQYNLDGRQRFLIDEVEDTTISNNIFRNVKGYTASLTTLRVIDGKISDKPYPFFVHPIMVEGDNNLVVGNKFYGQELTPKYSLIGVKTAYRHTLGLPLKGNFVIANTYNDSEITLARDVLLRGDEGTLLSNKLLCSNLSMCQKKYSNVEKKAFACSGTLGCKATICGEDSIISARATCNINNKVPASENLLAQTPWNFINVKNTAGDGNCTTATSLSYKDSNFLDIAGTQRSMTCISPTGKGCSLMGEAFCAKPVSLKVTENCRITSKDGTVLKNTNDALGCLTECHKALTDKVGTCIYDSAHILHKVSESSFGSCQILGKESVSMVEEKYKDGEIQSIRIEKRNPRFTKMNMSFNECKSACPNLAAQINYRTSPEMPHTKFSGEYGCFYGGYLIQEGKI